jgi:hypothetical protein
VALAADELHVGLAVVDITPPRGYRMSGYFNERFNTGTHDPLQAKALVLRQAGTQAALVFCDLIGPYQAATDAARQQASQKTGIPPAHILVHGTHSHTGPLYEGVLRRHFHEQAIKQQGTDPHEEIDYQAFLAQRVAEAITQAHTAAAPVTITAGTALQRGLSFNRRFHMRDGSVRFNPGKLNPDIVRPAGPIDPEVGLVHFKSRDGDRPLGSLTVFALHLDTVGGTEYSADYPFYLERSLRQSAGNEFVSLFGNGTCGDINHVDVTNDRPQKGHEEAARIGTALAETVRGALGGLEPVAAPRLGVRRGVVEAPIQQYSADEVAQARRDLFKVGGPEPGFLEQVKAVKIVAVADRAGKLPLEVQVFRLSDDLAIVGLPGEVFVDLGLTIKKQSPFSRTFVIELCNDTPAYIPTKTAFAEGSYETVNSLIAPGAGESLVETALALLKELKEAK